jgi:hypothetical protein
MIFLESAGVCKSADLLETKHIAGWHIDPVPEQNEIPLLFEYEI